MFVCSYKSEIEFKENIVWYSSRKYKNDDSKVEQILFDEKQTKTHQKSL